MSYNNVVVDNVCKATSQDAALYMPPNKRYSKAGIANQVTLIGIQAISLSQRHSVTLGPNSALH